MFRLILSATDEVAHRSNAFCVAMYYTVDEEDHGLLDGLLIGFAVLPWLQVCELACMYILSQISTLVPTLHPPLEYSVSVFVIDVEFS